ncbi:MAG: DNA primase [Planctomycetia bacterium]|nr:DNA primase [Planctomycetia bacterium]
MLSGSSFEAKEQVKRAISIVDLVGDYLQLRREGRAYKALCPWHDDTRPSLQVNPERQSFKCWVCDIGGDIFSFVMKMEGVSFPEALELLAERAGIELKRSGRPGPSGDDKRLLYQAMAWAEEQYHQHLLRAESAAVAREYLRARGVTEESVRRFRLGFAPADWEWIAQQARNTRFSPQVLETIGLVGRRQNGPGWYDRFRGRVLFSIRDGQGRPVGLGGRVMPGGDEERAAKYINSPETPLFSKSNLVYGLDTAREAIVKERTVVVMEGYTDCLIAQQSGIANAVAVLGTAFGERHLQLLRRYADRVVLVLDGDEAGRRRTDQLLEMFIAEPVDLRILTLPEELDPCDFLLGHGRGPFEELLAGAVDALEHKFNTASRGSTAQSAVHEANRVLEEVLGTLAKAPRLAASESSAARLKQDQVLQRLARKFELSEDRVRARLSSLRQSSRGRPLKPSNEAASTPAPTLDAREQELLELALLAPDCLPRMREEISAEQLTSPAARAILKSCYALAGTTPSLFDRLLVEFDDPELKSLLVDLDERGRAKGTAEVSARFDQVLASYRRMRHSDELRRQSSALAKEGVDEKTELEILQQIIDRERMRQGISVPTDG